MGIAIHDIIAFRKPFSNAKTLYFNQRVVKFGE
jgi:hypothetical protein